MLENLVHIGKIIQKNYEPLYLFLYKEGESYLWLDTAIVAKDIPQAIQKAYEVYGLFDFSLLKCGFRYTLPERDEIGTNALFMHMVKSYHSMNGVYYDEELEHNCFVDFASLEALNLLKELQKAEHAKG